MGKPIIEEVIEFTDNLINSNEFKEFVQRRKNNTYNLITSNVIKKGGVISEDKPLKERIIESNKRIVALINKLNKEKEMKHEFQNAKIVVGENSIEIQEILFGLGYVWSTGAKQILRLTTPFIFIYENGTILHANDNEYFYKHKYPLITLDTLKQWQRENVELVKGYFYATEKTDECAYSIFQFKETYDEYISAYFGIIANPDNTFNPLSINETFFSDYTCVLRPATQEEIQLLKDKVKEQTGNVFNEETKMFEEPKKKVEFKPFDKVLIRRFDSDIWEANIFSRKIFQNNQFYYATIFGAYSQCIPYEGNEHLLGTTNNPE